MNYAPRLTRLLGQFIDGLLTALPFLLTLLLGLVIGDIAGPLSIVASLAGLGYYFLADGLEGGQSIGKRWLGIAVIDRESGQPCSFMQSFVRNLLLAILGPIDWVFIFGERHQRLGDMVAGTVVVSRP